MASVTFFHQTLLHPEHDDSPDHDVAARAAHTGATVQRETARGALLILVILLQGRGPQRHPPSLFCQLTLAEETVVGRGRPKPGEARRSRPLRGQAHDGRAVAVLPSPDRPFQHRFIARGAATAAPRCPLLQYGPRKGQVGANEACLHLYSAPKPTADVCVWRVWDQPLLLAAVLAPRGGGLHVKSLTSIFPTAMMRKILAMQALGMGKSAGGRIPRALEPKAMTHKVPSMKMMLSEILRLREACSDQMMGSGNNRTATSPKTFRMPDASKKSWMLKQ